MSEELKMPEHVAEFDVGEIGNQYGSLAVKVVDGKAYWSIENCYGHSWQRIPDYLYFSLVRFEAESK